MADGGAAARGMAWRGDAGERGVADGVTESMGGRGGGPFLLLEREKPIRFLWPVSSFGCKVLPGGAFFCGSTRLDSPRSEPCHKRLQKRAAEMLLS